MVHRETACFIDRFDRAQALSTTPGMNGWTVKDTSSGGTPTYLCTSEEGMKLTLVNTSEAEIVTMFHNDVLMFDAAKIQHFWFVAKVAGIDAVTTLVFGMASAQNDTADTVAESIWFRMEGSASTSNLLVESDDATTNKDDIATGLTLGSTFKKCLVDLSDGLAAPKFYVDGQRVAASTTFDMSAITAGQNLQPFVQLQKASGTGVPSISIAEFGIQYTRALGA